MARIGFQRNLWWILTYHNCNHTNPFWLFIIDDLSHQLFESSVLLLNVVVHCLSEPPQLKADREGRLYLFAWGPFH